MKKSKSNFDYSDLKELIDKMSKNEKRYFTVNTSQQLRNGKNNFIELFKVFAKNPEKELPEIENKIKTGLPVKNITETKHQLFNLLFKNLHNYHIESSVESEIQFIIHCIEITYSKSLNEIAKVLLQRAWEKALKNETFTLLLILLQWKAKLYKTNTEETKAINIKEAEVLKQLLNLNRYNKLKEELRTRVIKFGGRIKNAEDKKTLEAFYNTNNILSDEKNALSFTALCQHHLINCGYYYCIGNIKEGYSHTKKLLEILRKQPELRALSSELYISNLQNAIIFSSNINNYPEAESLINELEHFKPNLQLLVMQKTVWAANSKIILYLRSGRIKDALERIKDFEKIYYETEKQQNQSPERFILAYLTAYLYFINAQYKLCLKWLNIVLNERNSVRNDIMCAAQVLFLITHYELKNDDYLPAAIINTSRVLNKKEITTVTEKLIVSFIKKGSAFNSDRKKHEALTDLRNEIEVLHKKDPIEMETSKYFDYIKWINCKLENIGMKKYFM